MFGILFRGFLLLFVMGWYTLGIWRLIDDYFRAEFKKQLDAEKAQSLPDLKAEFNLDETLEKNLKSDTNLEVDNSDNNKDTLQDPKPTFESRVMMDSCPIKMGQDIKMDCENNDKHSSDLWTESRESCSDEHKNRETIPRD